MTFTLWVKDLMEIENDSYNCNILTHYIYTTTLIKFPYYKQVEIHNR